MLSAELTHLRMHGRPRVAAAKKPGGSERSPAVLNLPDGDSLLTELLRLCDADPLIDEFGILPTPEVAAAVLADASAGAVLSHFPDVFVLCEHKLGVLAAALKPIYLATRERVIVEGRHARNQENPHTIARALLAATVGVLLLVSASPAARKVHMHNLSGKDGSLGCRMITLRAKTAY